MIESIIDLIKYISINRSCLLVQVESITASTHAQVADQGEHFPVFNRDIQTALLLAMPLVACDAKEKPLTCATMANHEHFDYPVTVKRTGRRKTVAIRIVAGSVQLTVPMRLSEKRITLLLEQKDNWIRTKLAQDAEKPQLLPREFVSGEAFPYLGKNYRLGLSTGARGEVQLKHGCLSLAVPEKLQGEPGRQYIRNQLARWYRDRATGWLDVKTQAFSEQLEVQPYQVQVKYFKSRWGSCSMDGTIKYNWRIIMAPHRIVDYLVVHELAHLVHHNHSPDYWRTVEHCLPNYRELRRWLKDNGALLSLDLTQL